MSQVVKVKSGGYHLKYSNPGSLAADREAEKDVREYLNSRQWNFLLEVIKSGATFQRIRFLTTIAGVRGYPVGAMLRLHHPRYLSRFSERRVMARKITVVIGDFPDQPGVFHDVFLEVETIEVAAKMSIRQLIATGHLPSDAENQSYLIAGVYEGHIQSIPEVWS